MVLYFQSKDPPCIEKHLELEEEIQRLTALKNALINKKRLLHNSYYSYNEILTQKIPVNLP